jgi:hypothetical protein
MTGHRHIVKHFGERERDRLGKLFRQLGTDNPHEAEAARGCIESLLRAAGKDWSPSPAAILPTCWRARPRREAPEFRFGAN